MCSEGSTQHKGDRHQNGKRKATDNVKEWNQPDGHGTATISGQQGPPRPEALKHSTAWQPAHGQPKHLCGKDQPGPHRRTGRHEHEPRQRHGRHLGACRRHQVGQQQERHPPRQHARTVATAEDELSHRVHIRRHTQSSAGGGPPRLHPIAVPWQHEHPDCSPASR